MATSKVVNLDFVFRTKKVDAQSVTDSKLARVLNAFDLTFLGKTILYSNFNLILFL